MAWTQEDDAKLSELHAKRLGVRFISVWLRQPAAAVRTRLVELGLEKPLSAKASKVMARAQKPAAGATRVEEAENDDLDDDEDGDLRASRGCPRGHLLSEAKIAALYRSAGCDYR
ncbi:MAG TPA: hypothetical protein VFA50_20140 [Stellaceae bacterium]|nr:hypothetical protein [Stellaceae bacterium]